MYIFQVHKIGKQIPTSILVPPGCFSLGRGEWSNTAQNFMMFEDYCKKATRYLHTRQGCCQGSTNRLQCIIRSLLVCFVKFVARENAIWKLSLFCQICVTRISWNEMLFSGLPSDRFSARIDKIICPGFRRNFPKCRYNTIGQNDTCAHNKHIYLRCGESTYYNLSCKLDLRWIRFDTNSSFVNLQWALRL